jgi:hypothetical protein
LPLRGDISLTAYVQISMRKSVKEKTGQDFPREVLARFMPLVEW